MNFDLLKTMCSLHAPSGNEGLMTKFLLDYITTNKKNWKCMPTIYAGENFQNSIILVFGQPTTAVYAHIDNIGFTVGYNEQLLKVGGPHIKDNDELYGYESADKIVKAVVGYSEDSGFFYQSAAPIKPGTDLSYTPYWHESPEFIQCCYLDNRLGVYNALMQCNTIENGAIVFTCWEEHGGGNAGYLAKFLYDNYKIKQSLISDITWVTAGVHHGEGVAISMRDSGIPRRVYVNKIIALAEASKVPFQIEVESAGGSDGTEIQKLPLPIDWCFIGAPESHVHSPREKVHKADIKSMIKLYQYLLKNL
ncbi:MAG: hypothetical protein RIQ89_1000 [Bacteroidota bacterium]|jgi:putative aminopeptidase FrvX